MSEQIIVKTNTSKIMHCSCKNEAQDKMYGQGMRLHNQTKQGKPVNNRGWRCTVCSNEKF